VKTEFKVGILVIVAIALLLYMSMKVGTFGFLTESGYILSIHFNNAGGLDKKAPVQVAGVEVGKVSSISLDQGKARVRLLMKKDVKMPVDSSVAIRSLGVLGDKYVEIVPGKSTTMAANGDELTNVVASADYDELLKDVSHAAKSIGDTMDQFKGIVGDKERESIKASLANIATVSGDFKQMVSENKANVKKIVTNMAQTSDKLEPLASKADSALTGINSIVGDVNAGKGTIGKLVKDDKLYNDTKDMVASLKSVSADIEQGKGTLGKLVKDETLYNDAKETVSNLKTVAGNLKEQNIVGEAKVTMKKVQQAAEGVQEQTPVTILGTIFGLFF
jgi:phospholipid/cholesterol/gamma-HCH transport system substrate-binding protein